MVNWSSAAEVANSELSEGHPHKSVEGVRSLVCDCS